MSPNFDCERLGQCSRDSPLISMADKTPMRAGAAASILSPFFIAGAHDIAPTRYVLPNGDLDQPQTSPWADVLA